MKRFLSAAARFRLAFAFLALVAAGSGAATYFALSGRPAGERPADAVPKLTPRQLLNAWFDAWNSNDARRLCSYYGRDMIHDMGGIEHCAAFYGRLAPLRFQIASWQREGDLITVGLVAGTNGGAVYIGLEDGAYKIVGFSG